MKKIGLISLALVMALGALGVTFAGWTDTVTVNGTVNTGDVVLEIEGYSGTIVWKVDDDRNEIYVQHGMLPLDMDDVPFKIIDAFPNDGDVPADLDPVATAMAGPGTTTDIFIEFENLFPCVDFMADFLLHYAGSIPVKVDVLELTADVPGLTAGSTVSIEYWESNQAGDKIGQEPMELAMMQLHYCDYILVVITIHVEQDNANQNLTGTITGEIGVKQWNEVVVPE
jgi:predicted ribosomally synthesized peptide with SipW-like signal peptide